jgi:hypothetical protein
MTSNGWRLWLAHNTNELVWTALVTACVVGTGLLLGWSAL